ncbi:hypothetical protein [Streptococcus equi]|nr:hypothetical protein [Streptococcus equi]
MADRIVEEVAIYRKLREMDDAEQDFLRQKKEKAIRSVKTAYPKEDMS